MNSENILIPTNEKIEENPLYTKATQGLIDIRREIIRHISANVKISNIVKIIENSYTEEMLPKIERKPISLGVTYSLNELEIKAVSKIRNILKGQIDADNLELMNKIINATAGYLFGIHSKWHKGS